MLQIFLILFFCYHSSAWGAAEPGPLEERCQGLVVSCQEFCGPYNAACAKWRRTLSACGAKHFPSAIEETVMQQWSHFEAIGFSRSAAGRVSFSESRFREAWRRDHIPMFEILYGSYTQKERWCKAWCTEKLDPYNVFGLTLSILESETIPGAVHPPTAYLTVLDDTRRDISCEVFLVEGGYRITCSELPNIIIMAGAIRSGVHKATLYPQSKPSLLEVIDVALGGGYEDPGSEGGNEP